MSDVAQLEESGVYLTPKRLLMGQPGWYESQYGATYTQKTDFLLYRARKSFALTPERRCVISNPLWGKADDLENLSREAAKLIHSDWTISRETIGRYPVTVTVTVSESESEDSDVSQGNPWKSLYDAYLSHRIRSIQAKYNQT